MADYSLDDYDFESLARKEPNARTRIRLLMMKMESVDVRLPLDLKPLIKPSQPSIIALKSMVYRDYMIVLVQVAPIHCHLLFTTSLKRLFQSCRNSVMVVD